MESCFELFELIGNLFLILDYFFDYLSLDRELGFAGEIRADTSGEFLNSFFRFLGLFRFLLTLLLGFGRIVKMQIFSFKVIRFIDLSQLSCTLSLRNHN